MKKNSTQETAIWAIAIWAFGVASVVAWQIAPLERKFFDGAGLLVNVATAIGTVGTVIVSLLLARKSDRRREEEDTMRARLAAARLVADLEGPLHALQNFTQPYGFLNLELGLDQTHTALVNADRSKNEIGQIVSKPQWNLDPALLQAIVPLGPNVAHRLEYGCRSLVALNLLIKEATPNWNLIHDDQRLAMVKEWEKRTLTAEEYISVAFNECRNAAELGAPPPTGEEKYGGWWD